MVDKHGRALTGSPLERLQALLRGSPSGVVEALAGDVQDVCAFVGAKQPLAAKLGKEAVAAIKAERGRTGAPVAIEVDDMKSLLDLAAKTQS